jgi:NADPH:quinone reductase-like Zn-dependent oxidoreductase
MSYRRVVITKFGGPEVLKLVEETRLPEPRPSQVRVKVLATGAAFTDTMIRKGMYRDVKQEPPFSPGYDMVGVVDALGEGVTWPPLGQRVAELTVTGAYAEYLCWPAERLVPVPDDVDVAEAVSLVLSYVTAYQMLHRSAQVRQGQRVLVHGAGGAVGSALLQLGRLLDLEMYGTESRAKQEVVAELGATPIDYQDEDFVQRVRDRPGDGVDAVFDPIGGAHFKRSFDVLRPGGVLVAYGFYDSVMGRGGSIPLDFVRLKLWDLWPNSRSTTFYSIAPWRAQHPDWFSEDLSRLFELLIRGQISPVIARQMPLSEAAQAHRLIEEGAVVGKIVLRADDRG